MPDPAPIAIDPNEPFEHLPNAPIVEAVIQFVAHAEVERAADELKSVLGKKLPEYSVVKSIGSLSFRWSSGFAEIGAAGPEAKPPTTERAWHGLRIESEDALNVASFTGDYFSFSRLRPYQNWETFSREALRLWEIHKGLADLSEIRRIGVRFINRLDPPVDAEPGGYLSGPMYSPGFLEETRFFYHDELAVPGHPFRVRLVRTLQPPAPSRGPGVLLDIDVFTQEPIAPDPAAIQERLGQMRWIKNRVFFGNVTERALDLCR